MKIAIRIEAALALVLAALPLTDGPAFGQAATNDTIKVMLAKGAVVVIDGQTYEFMPRPDGSYIDIAGAPKGTYRAIGAMLCVTPAIYGSEACFTIPAGKKAGETFDMTNEQGQPAAVTIR